MTWPVPPAVPISPMMARMMSLAVTPGGSWPSTWTSMFLALAWINVCVASTCSTSLVPIPCASAPKAPCVEVWLSPQTIVVPGSVKPCSGRDDVDDALPGIEFVEIFDAEGAGVLGQSLDLHAAFGFLYSAAPVRGLYVVIDDRQGLAGRPDATPRDPQAFEGLRARHLVDEMAVDVEQARPVRLAVDDMIVPDLVVERARHRRSCLNHGGPHDRAETASGRADQPGSVRPVAD